MFDQNEGAKLTTAQAMSGGWPRPRQGSIDRRPRHLEQLRQVADGVIPGVIHAPQLFLLFLRQFGLLALQLPLGPGHRHALPSAHPDQVALELSEGGQDVEEHLAHGVERIMNRAANLQLDPPALQLFSDGPRIRHRSGEAIQLRHDERVAHPGCG